jgi:hypothetical protein
MNGDLSFRLTNSTSHPQRLAYIQVQRYFVEHAFFAMQNKNLEWISVMWWVCRME